jgi:endogenous inhibitor of DNA gyrase (YacG/DUF329 family)
MPATGPGDSPDRDWPDRPFCSPRCRLIDLGRWLGEDYRFPAGPTVTDEEDTESTEVEET